MASPDRVTQTLNPNEFFESIGSKVESLEPATNGVNGTHDEDELRPVEEIESLCMSCGENVRPSSVDRDSIADHITGPH